MFWKLLKSFLFLLVAAIIASALFIFAVTDTNKYSRHEIAERSKHLFEFGSVGFFHGQSKNSTLFPKIVAGQELGENEDCIYKTLYTQLIANNASFLKLMDENIHFENDYGLNTQNNCREMGIPGRHDLHDLSALNNIEDINSSLQSLTHAGFIEKIALANNINKDMLDLMVHFAPATHAIGVHDSAFTPKNLSPELLAAYQNMISGFKAAQFSPVNSCPYWQGVDQALDAYTEIILYVQDQVHDHLSTFERKIAGRWLSLQTIAPQLDLKKELRPRPQDC